MSKYLSFYGGKNAVSIIKEKGLTQDIVKVAAGAAGGPKWLVLSGIDKFLFSEWFAKRSKSNPLFLLGSSAGAWRFAAASHNDPLKALEKFKESYINQWYSIKPTLKEIDIECQKVLNRFLDDNSVDEILNHPYCRINFFSVKSKGAGTKSDNPFILLSSITAAAAANLFSRKYLNSFFTRTLFYNPSEKPPFYDIDNFPMLKIALNQDNFKKALLSSGSIPLVMPGIKDIPNVPKGVYRDGGTIDYHLDIPFLDKEHHDKIVLFPHYTNRIIPGWLDKQLFWRKADSANFKNVLIITPTKKFTDMLPDRKIPERKDFNTFKGKNRERIQRWKVALKYSDILGDELCNMFCSSNIADSIQPIQNILLK